MLELQSLVVIFETASRNVEMFILHVPSIINAYMSPRDLILQSLIVRQYW